MELNNKIINSVSEIIQKSYFTNNESSVKNTASILQSQYNASGFDDSYTLILRRFMQCIKMSRAHIADLMIFVQLQMYYVFLSIPCKYVIGSNVMYQNNVYTVEDYIEYLDLYLLCDNDKIWPKTQWIKESEIQDINNES